MPIFNEAWNVCREMQTHPGSWTVLLLKMQYCVHGPPSPPALNNFAKSWILLFASIHKISYLSPLGHQAGCARHRPHWQALKSTAWTAETTTMMWQRAAATGRIKYCLGWWGDLKQVCDWAGKVRWPGLEGTSEGIWWLDGEQIFSQQTFWTVNGSKKNMFSFFPRSHVTQQAYTAAGARKGLT